METARIVSFCGDVCSECPRYIATKNNDLPELQYLSELWYKLGFKDKLVDPEELKCYGCSPKKDCTFKINKCQELEHKKNCGECEMFPCASLEVAFERADYYKEICKERCSELEYKILSRAFLLKKEVLTEINHKHKTP